jgi:hypothetical protein
MAGVWLCCEIGKPAAITFLYTGSGSDVITQQDDCKATATGDPFGEATVLVTSNVNDDQLTVNVGEMFTIAGNFRSNTEIIISDVNGHVLQELTYHTSCSQPMLLGDVIGSIELVGYLGKNGESVEPVSADELGDDADTPEQSVTVEYDQDVVFNYVVKNTVSNTSLSLRTVWDDNATPDDVADDFVPQAVLDSAGLHNVGDANQNDRLDYGEQWRFTATKTADQLGQFRNKATAVGMPVDATGARIGVDVLDMDSAHLTVADPLTGVDLCDVLDKPAALTFVYTGDDASATDTAQDSGKAFAVGDPAHDPSVFIIVSSEDRLKDAICDTGKQLFAGTVELGESFTADIDNACKLNKFGSSTHFYIFDCPGGTLLQTIEYHTSCSQPLQLGDVIGGVTLTGYEDVIGESVSMQFGSAVATLPPDAGAAAGGAGGAMFDVTDLGDNADLPTGPSFRINDQVQFTYAVSTPVPNVELRIDQLLDDNATVGATSDDFEPVAVLVAGFNFGDTDQDGLLDSGEIWYYTAAVTATQKGQFKNTATVTGTQILNNGDEGSTVTDDDSAHYLVESIAAIDIEKYVRVDEGCIGKHGQTGQWSPFDELGADADAAPGIEVNRGDKVEYNYVLTNTGEETLDIVSLIDDNATSNSADDFTPVGVVDSDGFNVGDANRNGLFDPSERWLFRDTQLLCTQGLHTNTAVVVAQSVVDGVVVTDQDVANVTVVFPPHDGCKPWWGDKDRHHKHRDHKGHHDKDRNDKCRDDKGRDDKRWDDKCRDDNGRDDKRWDDKCRDDNGRDDKRWDDKWHDDKGRDDKRWDDKCRDDKGRDDKRWDDKWRDDKGRDDKRWDDKWRDDKGRDDKGRDDKRWDDKCRDDNGRDDKRWDDKWRDDKGHNGKSGNDKGRDDKQWNDKGRNDKRGWR